MWPFKKKRKPILDEVDFGFISGRVDQALELDSRRYPALDQHFELTNLLRSTYTPSSEQAVEKGIKICKDMISISKDARAAWNEQEDNRERAAKIFGDTKHKRWPLPVHLGFQQLAIILEKRGDLDGAIHVAKQAQVEGWDGDWEKRIARCEAKIVRARTTPRKPKSGPR